MQECNINVKGKKKNSSFLHYETFLIHLLYAGKLRFLTCPGQWQSDILLYQTTTVKKWLAYFGLRDIPVCTLAEEPGKWKKEAYTGKLICLAWIKAKFFSQANAFASVLKTGQNRDREQEMKRTKQKQTFIISSHHYQPHMDRIVILLWYSFLFLYLERNEE